MCATSCAACRTSARNGSRGDRPHPIAGGGDAALRSALDSFTDFVRSETLAVAVAWEKADSRADKSLSPVEAGDKLWLAAVEKA